MSSDPPREVEVVWIEPDSARYLLDMLAIDAAAPEYLATDPTTAPDFSWWWTMYIRTADPGSAQPEQGVFPYPPREYCHEPAVLLAALTWLRDALDVDGLLKRKQFWAWFRPGMAYVPGEFSEPFREELESWRRACERAHATGMKVALRVGE